MDPERARVLADLQGIIDGKIACDDLTLQMYATDASIHEIRPLAVISPARTQDVVKVVNYCRENQIPLHPRGSGSNVIGGCLGPGIVLDLSENMRRMISIDRESVTVQAGAVLAQVNRELTQHHGRFISPDPATRSISTVGGMVALNLTGSHWVKYGSPRDRVLSLQVVLASGELIEIDSALSLTRGLKETPTVQRLEQRVRSVLESRAKDLQQTRPQVELSQAGYNLWDLDRNGAIDLTRLFVGSEGTLGIITRVTLQTDPVPKHRGVALLFFDRLENAAKAALEIHGTPGLATSDLLDRRLLTLARETDPRFHQLIPANAEAMLLVEFQAEDEMLLRERLEQLAYRIVRRKRLAFEIRTATLAAERNLFWRLTRRVTPTLYRLRGQRRAVPFVEAVAVPPAKLPDLLAAVHQILNRHELTASLFAHTPQGILQIHPFIDLSSPTQVQALPRLAEALLEKVSALGGTLSGIFGDGLSRTWALRRQFGPAYSAFVEIKNVFDPTHLFNPGKIIDQPALGLTDQLRHVSLDPNLEGPLPIQPAEGTTPVPSVALPVLQPQLNWSLAEMNVAARNCNGCGRCRTQGSDQRMCPIFRISPEEAASPRAKANLMRGVLTGQLPPEALGSDEFRSLADLCVNCHQCRLECPAGVDIPQLMIEAKAQHVLENGLGLSDWLLSRLDLLYWLAGRLPRVTNALIQNRSARWLLDRLLGIAQGRRLPRFSQRSFLQWASHQKLHRVPRQHGRKVVFFVDAFVNWNDLELGQALVKVLQHNNIDVVVPLNQGISGMSLISDGVLARAKKLALKNVELLADYVRQGFEIVTMEPSAALALKHEYVNLIPEQDAALVAAHTHDVCHYLWRLHQNGALELDFYPTNVTVGYHQPCHQRALQIGTPGVELLKLIPGVQVDLIDVGCSGMAGTWGLKSKNYSRSLRMGRPLFKALRSPDIVVGTTECTTCKIQMSHGTHKITVHPLKILALAYRVLPQLGDLFSRRNEELIVS